MPVMRQTGPMQRWRKYARGGVGMRGLGQAGCLASMMRATARNTAAIRARR